MPDDALRLPPWIEIAARHVACLCEQSVPGSAPDWRAVAEVIEQSWETYLAALPVAEPCDTTLLRECRQLARIELLASQPGSDREWLAGLVRRIDRQLAEE